jgi:putative PIG3 family NAD(P)H quinone oxidoreductase
MNLRSAFAANPLHTARIGGRYDRPTMRAATIRDGRITVEEHPDPRPEAGELLIRVHGAGINGADILQLKGAYPAPPGSPQDIPGLELAGEVVATGAGVLRFEVGDRVMAVVGGGGQAELAVVHERLAMPVPDELDWTAAGGTPEVFTTAHDALFTQAGLQPGERLLVHGAAGGVGTAAVQLGTMAGARVTATVRDEACRAKIATLDVNALAPDEFVAAGPYDVILELVGAPNWPANLEALADRGRIAVIGVGAGAKVEINLHALMARRGRITGSTLRSRALEDKADAARRVERSVLPGFASGDLSVFVAETFPLDEVAAAYERFQAGGKLGKIVLAMEMARA